MYNIHILENNEYFSNIVAKKLIREGFEVTQAFSIYSKVPNADLYLIDLHLEDYSYDIIRNISKPIIVISWYDDEVHRKITKSCWINKYLIKWLLRPSELILEINKILWELNQTN